MTSREDHDGTEPDDAPTLPPSSDKDDEEATLPPKHSDKSPVPPTLLPDRDEAKVSVGDRVEYFGDYELIEEIARGGMGVVYRAKQRGLNRIVALKMILAGQLAGPDDVARFKTEAEAAAQLDHWGIVPIYEIGEHEGQHYFSMAFVDGDSLQDMIRSGPMDPREAASFSEKIAEAMTFAHEKGVIHRDLKPANVLIDQAGTPKVTDFGLAKKTQVDSNLTGTGQILGTPGYMPPEQASGDTSKVDERADVYSLGAILYALLTGRAPFQSANALDTLIQVLETEPLPPRKLDPGIPRDIESVCLKALSKEPSQRYQSAQLLMEDLQRFLNNEQVVARPSNALQRAYRWMRLPNRVRDAGVLAIVNAVTLGLYYLFFRVSDVFRSGSIQYVNAGITTVFFALICWIGIRTIAKKGWAVWAGLLLSFYIWLGAFHFAIWIPIRSGYEQGRAVVALYWFSEILVSTFIPFILVTLQLIAYVSAIVAYYVNRNTIRWAASTNQLAR